VLVGATHLFLATDVDALYTSNPHAAPAPGVAPAQVKENWGVFLRHPRCKTRGLLV
jgi:hypothetical protein